LNSQAELKINQTKQIKKKIKVQSNLCTTASLGTQKNWPLFKSGRYPGADHEKLLYTLAGWGLGRSLLTGGRCSEVAVNTGLTVSLIF
jgi:hypothetical protein